MQLKDKYENSIHAFFDKVCDKDYLIIVFYQSCWFIV